MITQKFGMLVETRNCSSCKQTLFSEKLSIFGKITNYSRQNNFFWMSKCSSFPTPWGMTNSKCPLSTSHQILRLGPGGTVFKDVNWCYTRNVKA